MGSPRTFGPRFEVLGFLTKHPYAFASRDVQHALRLTHKTSNSALIKLADLGRIARTEKRPDAFYLYAARPEYLERRAPVELQAPPFKSALKARMAKRKHTAKRKEAKRSMESLAAESERWHQNLPKKPPRIADWPTICTMNALPYDPEPSE